MAELPLRLTHGAGFHLDCGCVMEWAAEETAVVFTYCPMHKAAPALLKALEKIERLGERCEVLPLSAAVSMASHARAAIAQAKE